MITLFTTAKEFSGINRVNQLNAIRSWLFSSDRPQVIIFGKSAGCEELGIHPNLIFTEQVSLSETGAPLGNEMFDAVNKMAKHPVCCYVNADIILPAKFFEVASALHKKLEKNYLLVGERWDVTVNEEMEFSDDWEGVFFKKYSPSFKLHLAAGSDIFLFPKGQYAFKNTRPFYIGRGGWDNWMIFSARKSGFRVVDITPSVRVIHLNHDYSHKKHHNQEALEKKEISDNINGVPQTFISIDTLGTCNYFFYDNALERNYTRGNLKRYAKVQQSLGQFNFFERFRVKAMRVLANLQSGI